VRQGTPAARMPQVPTDLRKTRAARLRAAGADRLQRYLASCVGGTANLLVETPETGRTETFTTARLSDAAMPGSIVPARLVGVDGAVLLAEAA
jgi:threonylcarbamoyladenosine tRNA methylthiotransferase MtaB